MAATNYSNDARNQGVHKLDLDNLFTYHPAINDQQERYVALRSKARELAELIVVSCPPSADTTFAIRLLRECVMTANVSIACGER